jgi:hypothetical protein
MAKLVVATAVWTMAALAAFVWNAVGLVLLLAFVYGEDANRVPGFPDPSDAMVGLLDVVRVAGSGLVLMIWAFGAAVLFAVPFGLGKMFRWYGAPPR